MSVLAPLPFVSSVLPPLLHRRRSSLSFPSPTTNMLNGVGNNNNRCDQQSQIGNSSTDGQEECDPGEWGFADEEDEEVDFRQKIADFTDRAHGPTHSYSCLPPSSDNFELALTEEGGGGKLDAYDAHDADGHDRSLTSSDDALRSITISSSEAEDISRDDDEDDYGDGWSSEEDSVAPLGSSASTIDGDEHQDAQAGSMDATSEAEDLVREDIDSSVSTTDGSPLSPARILILASSSSSSSSSAPPLSSSVVIAHPHRSILNPRSSPRGGNSTLKSERSLSGMLSPTGNGSNGGPVRAHSVMLAGSLAPPSSSSRHSSSSCSTLRPAPRALSQPCHSHSSSHSSGSASSSSSNSAVSRNLSLDSSARLLGLNIVYVERLALPLLRSEISSFFLKLTSRVDLLLRGVQTDPRGVMEHMHSGMIRNAALATDQELRRDFHASARQVQNQIDDIAKAEGARRIDECPKGAEGTGEIPASADPSSSTTSTSNSPFPLQRSLSAIDPSAQPVAPPSPRPPRSASACASTLLPLPFAIPPWWPASTQQSYASLLRIHAIFSMLSGGFNDAALVNGAAADSIQAKHGRHSLPLQQYTAATAASSPIETNKPHHKHAHSDTSNALSMGTLQLIISSTDGSPMPSPLASPSSISAPPPSTVSSTSSASSTSIPSILLRRAQLTPSSYSTLPPHRRAAVLAPTLRLSALPTTHSNGAGLQLLARILQAFSMLTAFEGGPITSASKLVLLFQRMANTMLEKYHIEEDRWKMDSEQNSTT